MLSLDQVVAWIIIRIDQRNIEQIAPWVRPLCKARLAKCSVASTYSNRLACFNHCAGSQAYSGSAEVEDCRERVANEQYSPPFTVRYILHLAETLFLELGIANSQHLVHDKNFWFQMCGDGEGKPHVHAR